MISLSALRAPTWTLLGSALRTFRTLWTQHFCSRVAGKTSRSARHSPSAPSPTITTGARMPRRPRSRSSSAQSSVDSRVLSATATSSLRPSARTPTITRQHSRPWAPRRMLKCMGRAGARCRRFGRSVSPARAAEPDVRVATHTALREPISAGPLGDRSLLLGPRCEDPACPVAVAADHHRARVDQRDLPVGRPPPWKVAPPQPLPGRTGVLVTQPADHPPPDEGAQVVEGRLGHPVLEVAGPSSQHLVELVQQDGERLVSALPGERPELRLDRCQRLLGRVGIDIALTRASLLVPLDAEPEKIEALVDMGDPRFRLRQAKAHRGKLRCDLLTQRLGMGTAASHQHDEIVRVAA